MIQQSRRQQRKRAFDRFSDGLMDSRHRRRIGTQDQCCASASDFEFADLRALRPESGVLVAGAAVGTVREWVRRMPKHRQIMALLLAGAACHKVTAPPPPPPPSVQVADVLQRDVPIYREWIGSLDGFVNTEIRPQVEGYVRKQVYREGTFVGQGELLFLIDPRNYKAVADQAKSTLDRDVAALAKARLDVRRDRQLIAQDAITQQQLDNDVAAEQQAAATVESDRAALARAQLNRDWTQVTSPIAGIAGIAQAQVGTLVSTSTTMTTVSQVDPIKVQFNIAETEYLRSAEGNHWAEPRRGAEPALELILDNGSVHPHLGTVV